MRQRTTLLEAAIKSRGQLKKRRRVSNIAALFRSPAKKETNKGVVGLQPAYSLKTRQRHGTILDGCLSSPPDHAAEKRQVHLIYHCPVFFQAFFNFGSTAGFLPPVKLIWSPFLFHCLVCPLSFPRTPHAAHHLFSGAQSISSYCHFG